MPHIKYNKENGLVSLINYTENPDGEGWFQADNIPERPKTEPDETSELYKTETGLEWRKQKIAPTPNEPIEPVDRYAITDETKQNLKNAVNEGRVEDAVMIISDILDVIDIE